MTFRNKAAYLVDSHRCRTFAEACALLARVPRKKVQRVDALRGSSYKPVNPVVAAQWYNSGGYA